jgi:hypothetical protein
LARRQRRFCRPFPRHPLLLIACRSVDPPLSPGAKAPGFFCRPGVLGFLAAVRLGGLARRVGWRVTQAAMDRWRLADHCAPARRNRIRASPDRRPDA